MLRVDCQGRDELVLEEIESAIAALDAAAAQIAIARRHQVKANEMLSGVAPVPPSNVVAFKRRAA